MQKIKFAVSKEEEKSNKNSDKKRCKSMENKGTHFSNAYPVEFWNNSECKNINKKDRENETPIQNNNSNKILNYSNFNKKIIFKTNSKFIFYILFLVVNSVNMTGRKYLSDNESDILEENSQLLNKKRKRPKEKVNKEIRKKIKKINRELKNLEVKKRKVENKIKQKEEEKKKIENDLKQKEEEKKKIENDLEKVLNLIEEKEKNKERFESKQKNEEKQKADSEQRIKKERKKKIISNEEDIQLKKIKEKKRTEENANVIYVTVKKKSKKTH